LCFVETVVHCDFLFKRAVHKQPYLLHLPTYLWVTT